MLAWWPRTKTHVIAGGTIATALMAILGLFGYVPGTPVALPSPESQYVSEIPQSALAADPGIVVNDDPPVRIAGLVYHQQRKAFDLRALNLLDRTAVVNRIVFHIRHESGWGANIPLSGQYEIKIPAEVIRDAKARRVPLELSRGFYVANAITPGGIERWGFPFALSESDLYIPDSESGGRYVLYVCMDVNGSWTTERFDLLALLRGEPDSALVGLRGLEQRVRPGVDHTLLRSRRLRHSVFESSRQHKWIGNTDLCGARQAAKRLRQAA
jgi:hypothetical protein